MTVQDDEKNVIGKISEVMSPGANDVWVIERPKKKDLLIPYIEEIEEALDHMGEAIQDNIRKVDVCTRYSAMQYLIILSHPAETQIPNIMSRIFMEYYKLQDSQHFTPSYEYISMKK